jgi:hypothetical protein
MTHGDIVTDNGRVTIAHVITFVMGDVNHTQILDITAITDFYEMNITAYNTPKPNAHILTHLNSTDNIGRGSNPNSLFEGWGIVEVVV